MLPVRKPMGRSTVVYQLSYTGNTFTGDTDHKSVCFMKWNVVAI